MKTENKLAENLMKITKVSGFVVSFPGDPSSGIDDANWTITGDFFFDNAEELEEFKAKLKLTWEHYCGENCKIYTNEEIDAIAKGFIPPINDFIYPFK